MAAFMKRTLYTKQVTVVTFRPTELHAGPEIYYCVVESLSEFFHACVLGKETLCVQLQPLVNVSNSKVDQMSQMLPKFRDPFRVVNLLPGPRSIPRVKKD
jgi:hypothetical protein